MNKTSLFLLLALLAACAPAEKTAGDGAAPATAGVTAPALYVDVRTAEEFASGHVAGAINIPYDQMPARWREIAAYRDSSVALYCQSGRRSGIALETLQEQGFTRVTNAGGFDDLRDDGVPTE